MRILVTPTSLQPGKNEHMLDKLRVYSSAHIISVGVQAPGKIRIWLSIAYSVTSLENPGVTRNFAPADSMLERLSEIAKKVVNS